jgi:pantothenate kinase
MLHVIKNRIGGVMVSVLASSEAQVNRIIFQYIETSDIKYYVLFVLLQK